MLKLFGQQRLDAYNSSSASRRRSRTFVINPLSRYRMFWDLCISLCILYSAIEIPFTTAFLPQPPLLMRVLDILIDSVLLSDVIVCFFTGYVDQDDVITMDHAKVVNHYLRGWFFFDLLSALPFDAMIDGASGGGADGTREQTFRLLNVLKLLRLVRLQKLVRYFWRWNDDLGLASSHSLLTQLVCLVFFVFLFIHTMACVEFLVPMLNYFPPKSWPLLLAEAGITNACAILIHEAYSDEGFTHAAAAFAPNASSATRVDMARGECYSHAFFQALSQMLCIGFGLVNPVLISELWVTIFSMACGAAVYSISLSFVVNVFSTVDYPSRMYKNTMEVLNEFMRVRTLPTELRVRLRSYFATAYPNRRIFNERAVIGEFSYALRGEIRVAQCASLFARTPIFENADAALLSAICPKLQGEIALPGDWLVKEGEVLNYVVFIDTGLVEVSVNDEQHVAEMGDGSYLGEISALGLGGEAARGLGLATASVKARDVCTIHALPKMDFLMLMRQFSDVLSAIQAVAQLRLARASSAKAAARAARSNSSTGGSPSMGEGDAAYVDKMTSLTNDDVHDYLEAQHEEQVRLQQEEARALEEAHAEAPAAKTPRSSLWRRLHADHPSSPQPLPTLEESSSRSSRGSSTGPPPSEGWSLARRLLARPAKPSSHPNPASLSSSAAVVEAHALPLGTETTAAQADAPCVAPGGTAVAQDAEEEGASPGARESRVKFAATEGSVQ